MTLPHLLIEAVKDHRVVIVFGAGASLECVDASGKTPPSANQLRDHLAKKFLGTVNEKRDLATVAEMAIISGAGQPIVFEEVSRLLSGFSPSSSHSKIAEFKWRGLATTNYDLFIEQGYNSNPHRRQTCLSFIKDTEPFDDRLRTENSPVALLKVHGCINHRLDPDVPLVLSREHYHRFSNNRTQLFNRLKQWAQSSHIVFIGYSLSDAHFQALIYDVDPNLRPQWYIVTPSADDHDRRYYSAKSIELLVGTFSDFVDALDHQVPALSRNLAEPTGYADAPYRKHFRTSDIGSDLLRHSLSVDMEYVHSGVSFEEVQPEKFYSGYDHGWCCIIRNYDFRRRAGEELLFSALSEKAEKPTRFLLLQGSAGAGKSIALRRAAYDASVSLDAMVFWLRDAGQARADVFEELFGLTGKTAILFVDRISIRSEAILELLKRLSARNIPITVVGAEREADWGSYCATLEEQFPPELHTLRKLSAKEAEDLVELLEQHNSLGLLIRKSRPERIAAFLAEDRADRQLLVALHELTLGKPFERIIFEEFESIPSEIARQLYLDISTMHQYGVIARAGAISRISGIRFNDFEAKFFAPLRDIVSVVSDPYTGDKGYESRHTRVSKIVFEQICHDDTSKARQLSRIISGLDVGYSSDRRILESICKGRLMASEFARIEPAREIFSAAIDTSPNSAFLHQQAAIMEYLHRDGSLELAQKFAEAARQLDGKNHIYIHTLAEVARRQAIAASSNVKAEKLRAQSRSYLNEIWLKDSRKDLTFCRLLIDEALDVVRTLSEEPKDHELVEFDEKVSSVVERLRRAQQDFPHEAEFPVAEGSFWQKLGESGKAARAFEKAISVRPRNAGVFSRLSRIQRAGGSASEARRTLERAIKQFPNDKNTHLQMALLLIESGDGSDDDAEFHLRSGCGAGDHNFDARFLLAEFCFMRGKVQEAKTIFDEIDSRAPVDFRKNPPVEDDAITSRLTEFAGVVEGIKDRYFFIRFGGYPTAVLGTMKALIEIGIDELRVGMPVMFHLRFNRRGPVAVTVWVP